MSHSIGEIEERLFYEFAKYEYSSEPCNEKDRAEAFKIAYIGIVHNRHLFDDCELKKYASKLFKAEWARIDTRIYSAYCYAYIRYCSRSNQNAVKRLCKPSNIFNASAWNLFRGEDDNIYDICIEHNQIVVKQLEVKRTGTQVLMATALGQLPDKVILLRYPMAYKKYAITCTREADNSGYIVTCDQYNFTYKTTELLSKIPAICDNTRGYIKYPGYDGKILIYSYFPKYTQPGRGDNKTTKPTPRITIIFKEPKNHVSSWIKK